MKHYTAIVEKDAETGYFVGYIPGIAGAHSQGDSLEELRANLQEVLEMLQQDGELQVDSEFVGTQLIAVA